ncbi:MAG: sulfotransferase [Chloroflexaceae bacterium]|nr:sulfotransferase [Chloroflexaceae bacterium]
MIKRLKQTAPAYGLKPLVHRLRLARLAVIHRLRNDQSVAAAASALPAPFIVGAPRSGTTLLRFMLDSHPELAIPPETDFIVATMNLWSRGSVLRRDFFQTLTHWPPEASGWKDYHVSEAAFWEALKAVEPFTVAEGLRCFYRLYAARWQKTRWGDKTPYYGPYVKAIERLLPEAYFVHIIRDGRDVMLSLRDLWFAPSKEVGALAHFWQQHVTLTRAQGQRCPHYLEVRYEQLIQEPQVVLQQICDFCQLDFHPNMESYFKEVPERLADVHPRIALDNTVVRTIAMRLDHHKLTITPPNRSRVQAWKHRMSLSERRQFEQVAGKLLDSLGYEIGGV